MVEEVLFSEISSIPQTFPVKSDIAKSEVSRSYWSDCYGSVITNIRKRSVLSLCRYVPNISDSHYKLRRDTVLFMSFVTMSLCRYCEPGFFRRVLEFSKLKVALDANGISWIMSNVFQACSSLDYAGIRYRKPASSIVSSQQGQQALLQEYVR